MLRVRAVRCDVSESQNAEKVCVGVCICVQPRLSCLSSMNDSKKIFSSLPVASAVLLRTCAARSGEVDYGDCRHECDHEE